MTPLRFARTDSSFRRTALLAAVAFGWCGNLSAQDAAAAAVQFGLRGATFHGVNLSGANLSGRDLTGADFQDATLTDVMLYGATLDRVDFRTARGLTSAQLASGRWNPEQPPRLNLQLNRFRRLWERRQVPSESLRGGVFWGRNLGGFNFTEANLQDAVFVAARMDGAVLLRANVTGALFAGADLTGADLRGAVGLTAGQLLSATWSRAKPPRVGDRLNLLMRMFASGRIVREKIPNLTLWRRDLTGTNFTGSDLSGSQFLGAGLRNATFREANLEGTTWNGSDITGADFRGAKGFSVQDLLSARWDPRRPPRLEENLNLERSFFERKELGRRSLSGVNWYGLDLNRAKLFGSNLRGAVLAMAQLRKASLAEADLSGAVLVGADLTGADLRGVRGLTSGQLLSARWDRGDPPRLPLNLEVAREHWERKRLLGIAVTGACVVGTDLAKMRFERADLSGTLFLGSQLAGSSFLRSDLSGVRFLGADLSGADLRGARNLSLGGLLSATWDVARPPSLDLGLRQVRDLLKRRRIEFDLQGVDLAKLDPAGVLGPPAAKAAFAVIDLKQPARVGLPRLLTLLRKGEVAQLWVRD